MECEDDSSEPHSELFCVIKHSDECVYPYVEGILPRKEWADQIEVRSFFTDKRFVRHHVALHSGSLKIENLAQVSGLWPMGESAIVLDAALPMQAPWHVAGDELAFPNELGEPQVYAYATPMFQRCVDVGLANAFLVASILKECSTSSSDAFVGYSHKVRVLNNPALLKTIVNSYRSALFSTHSTGIQQLTVDQCRDPWDFIKGLPLDAQTNNQRCQKCGALSRNAISTGADCMLVCPGRLVVRVHDRDIPSQGGYSTDGTRFSALYQSCGEVVEAGSISTVVVQVADDISSKTGANPKVATTDGVNYKYVHTAHTSYSSKEHLHRKMTDRFSTPRHTEGAIAFIHTRLLESAQLYYSQGDTEAALAYMLNLISWTGKTCRTREWRRISSQISARMNGACRLASIALCGKPPTETIPTACQTVLVNTLRSKMTNICGQGMGKVEKVGTNTVRYVGKGSENRIIFEVLVQFVSASLDVTCTCVGKRPKYPESDSRAIASRTSLLNRLNEAARALGWPECEFREDREISCILFRKKYPDAPVVNWEELPYIKGIMDPAGTRAAGRNEKRTLASIEPAPSDLFECVPTKARRLETAPGSSLKMSCASSSSSLPVVDDLTEI